jgi:hypothetical protein
MYYQALEMPKFSNLICAFRSFVFLPIVLFTAAYFYGTNGIWASMIFSEILSLEEIKDLIGSNTSIEEKLQMQLEILKR